MRYFLLFVGLMLSVSIGAQTVKWRDIYTVKKKDTIFGIANKYGLSLPELMDANPEMKREGYMLQKGATLFIPYTKDQKNPNQLNGQKSGNGATGSKFAPDETCPTLYLRKVAPGMANSPVPAVPESEAPPALESAPSLLLC